MSVLKSKRNIANTKFLVNIQNLQQEVLTWCKSQGNKNALYGLTELFTTVNRAFYLAYHANEIPLSAQTIEARKKDFKESIRQLHSFNAQLTALMSCYNISNTKLKRWSGYVYHAIEQMDGVISSDKKRVNN